MESATVVSYPTIDSNKDPFADAFSSNPNDATRTYPRTFASGNQQGTQTLSDSRVFIDSGNGRITFKDDDGNEITIGIIASTDTDSSAVAGFGFSFVDADGKNNIILGKLPDGSVNLAIAKPGKNVGDAFTT